MTERGIGDPNFSLRSLACIGGGGAVHWRRASGPDFLAGHGLRKRSSVEILIRTNGILNVEGGRMSRY